MQPFNDSGSFLIRNSESTPGEHSLSVRFANGVRHYRIKQSSKGYCVSNWNAVFKDIPKLVTHYSNQPDGLCVNLKKACLITKPRTASSSEENEMWETDKQSVEFVKKLGTGQFGGVWQGIWNGTTEVAVKILEPGIINGNELYQEAAIMKHLQHPKLIQFYAVCSKEEPIYIITELMKHGSLLEYLRGDGRSLKLPQLIDMGAQITSGMAYLEKNKLTVHYLKTRRSYVKPTSIIRKSYASKFIVCILSIT